MCLIVYLFIKRPAASTNKPPKQIDNFSKPIFKYLVQLFIRLIVYLFIKPLAA